MIFFNCVMTSRDGTCIMTCYEGCISPLHPMVTITMSICLSGVGEIIMSHSIII